MSTQMHILVSRLLQFVFHPLIVVCYAPIIVMQSNVLPFFFVPQQAKDILIQLFVWMIFIFPMLLIILLNKQKFLSSYSVLSPKDLRLVLIAVGFSLLTVWFVLWVVDVPTIVTIIPILAIVNEVIIFLLCKKVKLNVYSLSMSALLTYLVLVSVLCNHNLLLAILASILCVGIINFSFIEEEISSFKSVMISSAIGVVATAIAMFVFL